MRKRKYKLNENIFDTITRDSAYWIGFLYGDGNCTSENKIRLVLSATDYEHLIKFRAFVGSIERPIKQFINFREALACGFEFRSWHMHDILKKYELTRRKENRGRLHQDLGQDSVIRDFIRGVFDADGCFYYDGLHKNNLFAEITGRTALLKDIKEALVRAGVISDKKKLVKNGCIKRIRLAKDDTIRFIKFIYADKPRYYLSRKYGMALSYLERLNDMTQKRSDSPQKYHRPVSEYNKGKKAEYYERVCFTENKVNMHLKDEEDVRGPDSVA